MEFACFDLCLKILKSLQIERLSSLLFFFYSVYRINPFTLSEYISQMIELYFSLDYQLTVAD